jgi:hypothetical protein
MPHFKSVLDTCIAEILEHSNLKFQGKTWAGAGIKALGEAVGRLAAHDLKRQDIWQRDHRRRDCAGY